MAATHGLTPRHGGALSIVILALRGSSLPSLFSGVVGSKSFLVLLGFQFCFVKEGCVE